MNRFLYSSIYIVPITAYIHDISGDEDTDGGQRTRKCSLSDMGAGKSRGIRPWYGKTGQRTKNG